MASYALNSSSTDTSTIFEQISTYPFSNDPEFQAGLQAILTASPQSAEEIETRTMEAQCFYISRKKNISNIDVDTYRQWLSAQQPRHSNNDEEPRPAPEPAAPYPRSFSHLVELITTGQPIPGIKEVPNTLHTGQESLPVTAKRKKPWETKDENGELADREEHEEGAVAAVNGLG